MKNWRKWVKYGVIVLGIGGIVGSIAVSKLKPLEVSAVSTVQADLAVTITEKGKVVNRHSQEIYSEVAGKIKEMPLDIGDTVERGTILAVIDVEQITSQIAELQGELKALEGMEQASSAVPSQPRITTQELVVAQASLALQQAEENFKRIQELYQVDAATTMEFNMAEKELKHWQSAKEQAEVVLQELKQPGSGAQRQFAGQKESIRASLEYLKKQKGKGIIKAERAGVVVRKNLKQGDFVTPGMQILTIASSDDLMIETFVNSRHRAQITTGSTVDVVFKLSGGDYRFFGVVEKIAPIAEERVSALGITEDRVKVTVGLPNKPDSLIAMPGITVDVIFSSQKTSGAVAVPKEAVFTHQGKSYVWLVKDGKAVTREVVVGISGDEMTEIKDGLQEGDSVLKDPFQKGLEEGVRVTLKI